MKILYSVIGLLSVMSPIASYYIKANTRNLHNDSRFDRRIWRGMQRKPFSGSEHRDSENIFDAHFTVSSKLPSPSKAATHTQEQPEQRITSSPAQQPPKQVRDVTEINQDSSQKATRQNPDTSQHKRPYNEIKFHEQNTQHQNIQPQTHNDLNVLQSHVSYPQQRNLNNNLLSAISLFEQDDHIPISDKALQKNPAASERSSVGSTQTMSRVLDEITRKVTDRQYRGLHNKRDTDVRGSISESMKKYIVGKDKAINQERQRAGETSRIGSHEDGLYPEESPYAIFYRMHPDSLDQPEESIMMGPMEDSNNDISSKKKGVSFGYNNEAGLKNSNVLKMSHRKVKNFSNYRPLSSLNEEQY